MRIRILMICATVLAAVNVAGQTLVRAHLRPAVKVSTQAIAADLTARLQAAYGAAAGNQNLYIGSEFCLACHSEYQSWRNTKHAQTLRQPMTQYSLVVGRGVTADYDRNGVDDFIQGLDFNQISSAWDPWKPNAPKLAVKNGQYTITIGQVEMPVAFVNGGTGEWRERYGVRIPASDSPSGHSDEIYFSPVQFNAEPNSYLPYKPEMWYGADKQPLIVPGMTRAQIGVAAKASFSKNCIGCHTTGIRSLGKTAQGEWSFRSYTAILYQTGDPTYFDYDGDGNPDLLGVGCEGCHGPGGQHVLGGGDPSKIVNPAKLSQTQANEVCGRCHNRVRSVPNNTYAWPYNDATNTEWLPATTPLANFYLNANVLWPDNETSYEHNQKYSEFNRSAHVTNPYEPMVCTTCHDPHAPANHGQTRTVLVAGGQQVTSNDADDTLCLACHASHGPFSTLTTAQIADTTANRGAIATVVEAHANHPYGPERSMGLSRCSRCHMAPVANTERESVHLSHTFFVVPPEKTLKYQAQGGMVNSCAVSCHSQKVNSFGLGLDPSITVWNQPFDVGTATALMKYYGPTGVWWVKTLQ